MTFALTAMGLSAGYTNPVVRNVDLQLAEGELLALLGPNGAGKTTLLLTLSGLRPRLGGDVRVGGEQLPSGRPAAAVAKGLVLVSDDRALFRALTVAEHLELSSPSRRDRKTSSERVLDYFPQLRGRLKVKAGDLSGGEQQMLAIGRAIMQSPKVLLIDELSMGLAPVIVQSLLPVLRRIALDEGTAIVLVEQHVSLALETVDRAMVLAHGDVVLSGSAASLAAEPELVERAYLGARDVVV